VSDDPGHATQRLANVAPELYRLLKRGVLETPAKYAVSQIRCETVKVRMRDGICLATDVYLPPTVPGPAVAVRTPYSRGMDALAWVLLSLARRGYVGISQDCRGTGESEPDSWDYYMYEPEDGYDFVEWVSQQSWFDGFLGSSGGSYSGQTQWQMAMHPRMSTIVPGVSGLGAGVNTARLHMFMNAYARSIGKGEGKVTVPFWELEAQMKVDTWATGYFNEPLHLPLADELLRRFPHLRALSPTQAKQWLWEYYCSLPCAGRAQLVKQVMGVQSVTTVEMEALPGVFGQSISHDRHTLPHPRPDELIQQMHAPVLMRTGWYDWALNDALATWDLLMRAAPEPMRSRCRLFIGPNSHNGTGYHEGMGEHPELHQAYGLATSTEMLLHWYAAVREDAVAAWPVVIFYLMGANEWCTASAWPPKEARKLALHLGSQGALLYTAPAGESPADQYTYDPRDPTPTVGGSILSTVYLPGSVDVSSVQQRPDVLTYTTPPLRQDLDVAGPLSLTVYASSTAVDTDFSARLCDVFPDGRAIQLQSGILRARFRNLESPELLEPGKLYRFEIDMWATANRFKAGHRLRLDISSADFPRYDRNSNLGGKSGDPIPARQTIYHDAEHPSHLTVWVLSGTDTELEPDHG
jgi:predicted acyl esterase